MKLSAALGALGLVLLALSFVPELWATSGVAGDKMSMSSPSPDPAYGKALFTAKGCAACHQHADVIVSATVGHVGAPNLTDYRPDPEFLRRWLRDPQAVRPGTRMPNLNLSDDEIEALIAFLSTNTSR